MPCFRHQGYASASQIVSMPARSIARADSSISSSGSIVSCMTPMRKGCAINTILSWRKRAAPAASHAWTNETGSKFQGLTLVASRW